MEDLFGIFNILIYVYYLWFMMVFIYPNALCMECYATAINIYPLNMIHIRGYT
jgi:hypothetical protein